jgi:hypothetical protein
MDKDDPTRYKEEFCRLANELENAKIIGDEWQNGSYASAKIKLQDAIRRATLEDINKELARLEQDTKDALTNNKDPPPRLALETTSRRQYGGHPPAHYR